MNDQQFAAKVQGIVAANGNNGFLETAKRWHDASRAYSYQYLLRWGGRPIIQDPQDVLALQEVLWTSNPTLVVETGVACGGSIMLSASLLAARAVFDGADPRARCVIGIDLALNAEVEEHLRGSGFAPMVSLLQGSSTAPELVAQLRAIAARHARKVFILDSDHTHEHVLAELRCYAPMLSPGDHLLVLDTGIEFMPEPQQTHPRWRRGSNPYTAVQAFLAEHGNDALFEIDDSHYHRFGITCARGGFLRRVR
jgi:cephalosporin hydroxylase